VFPKHSGETVTGAGVGVRKPGRHIGDLYLDPGMTSADRTVLRTLRISKSLYELDGDNCDIAPMKIFHSPSRSTQIDNSYAWGRLAIKAPFQVSDPLTKLTSAGKVISMRASGSLRSDLASTCNVTTRPTIGSGEIERAVISIGNRGGVHALNKSNTRHSMPQLIYVL
jgi:hypothetical protein